MSKTMKYILTCVVENKLEFNARAAKTYDGHSHLRIGDKILLEVFNFRG